MKGTCQDCDTKKVTLYTDHRDPPLDDGPCLCRDCAVNALEERISDLQREIDELQEIQTKIAGSTKC